MFLCLRPIFMNWCLPPLLENMFKFRNWKYIEKKNKSEEKLSRPKFYQKKTYIFFYKLYLYVPEMWIPKLFSLIGSNTGLKISIWNLNRTPTTRLHSTFWIHNLWYASSVKLVTKSSSKNKKNRFEN